MYQRSSSPEPQDTHYASVRQNKTSDFAFVGLSECSLQKHQNPAMKRIKKGKKTA